MKTNHLRHLNREIFKTNTLKAGVVLAAGAVMGVRAYHDKTVRIERQAKIEQAKQKLELAREQDTTATEDQTITISDKQPLAIIYCTDGQILLQFGRTIMNLEKAMEEYPDITAKICEYIEATHGPIQTSVQNTNEQIEKTME